MGLMGLGLSIVGLYGLVAYAASRRTREIGIRMAIGATAPNVLRMVLRRHLRRPDSRAECNRSLHQQCL
jgi:ABC-type antimicrobial peptide transport system permease subunit